MSEVTKEDIHEIHQRIDTMVQHQNDTNVKLAEIATTLQLLPAPPDRPCHFHDELRSEVVNHLEDHDQAKKLWQRPIISGLIRMAQLGIVAALTWLWTRKD